MNRVVPNGMLCGVRGERKITLLDYVEIKVLVPNFVKKCRKFPVKKSQIVLKFTFQYGIMVV